MQTSTNSSSTSFTAIKNPSSVHEVLFFKAIDLLVLPIIIGTNVFILRSDSNCLISTPSTSVFTIWLFKNCIIFFKESGISSATNSNLILPSFKLLSTLFQNKFSLFSSISNSSQILLFCCSYKSLIVSIDQYLIAFAA